MRVLVRVAHILRVCLPQNTPQGAVPMAKVDYNANSEVGGGSRSRHWVNYQ